MTAYKNTKLFEDNKKNWLSEKHSLKVHLIHNRKLRLTKKAKEHWLPAGVFIANFENVSD